MPEKFIEREAGATLTVTVKTSPALNLMKREKRAFSRAILAPLKACL